jgi:hypothetical protein
VTVGTSVDIAAEPYRVSPKGRHGTALVIPLTAAPDDIWLAYFRLASRAELRGDSIWVWDTDWPDTKVKEFTALVRAAIQVANHHRNHAVHGGTEPANGEPS